MILLFDGLVFYVPLSYWFISIISFEWEWKNKQFEEGYSLKMSFIALIISEISVHWLKIDII